MFKSLTTKLTLAFLAVSLIGVTLVAVFSRLITEREFDRFRLEQAQSDFAAEVTAYYRTYGSWQGIDSVLGQDDATSPSPVPQNQLTGLPPTPPQRQTQPGDVPSPQGQKQPDYGTPPPAPPQGQTQPGNIPPPQGEGLNQPANVPPPAQQQSANASTPPKALFALANQDSIIVLADGPYHLGDKVPADNLRRQGIPLEIDGKQVGVILSNNPDSARNQIEEQYLSRTTRAVMIAAVGAMIIAVGVGVLLARTLARPLRELTAATLAMAAGELAQTVPVRSQDELGQLAQAFNRMSAAVVTANQLRRQMTADVAHDLRTPLSVINGYLEAMRDGDLAPTPPRLEAIYAEAQHLNRLVTDLRTMSLADANELPINRQAVSMPDLLAGVAAAYAYQTEQQQINLTVQVEDNLPPLNADPNRLAQVLGNLVSNALRYTPPGGQIILSAARHQANQIQLQVKDTGQGISATDLPYIFRRFYRTDKTRRQTEGESGLGLAIVKAIVETHGGTVTAESEPGQGSTFTILLDAFLPPTNQT